MLTAEMPVREVLVQTEVQVKDVLNNESRLIAEARMNPGSDFELALYNNYFPSIYEIANKFFTYNNVSTVDGLPTRADFTQEAFIPFRRALQDFDEKRGYKFHTVVYTYVEQHFLNARKKSRTQKANPQIEVLNPEDGAFTNITVRPISIHEPAMTAGQNDTDQHEILDMISDSISNRPDWQQHWKALVNDVENELNSQKKKDVFRNVLEYGLNHVGLKAIREAMGLKSSELSNILGRDIYPTVLKIIKENEARCASREYPRGVSHCNKR